MFGRKNLRKTWNIHILILEVFFDTPGINDEHHNNTSDSIDNNKERRLWRTMIISEK